MSKKWGSYFKQAVFVLEYENQIEIFILIQILRFLSILVLRSSISKDYTKLVLRLLSVSLILKHISW